MRRWGREGQLVLPGTCIERVCILTECISISRYIPGSCFKIAMVSWLTAGDEEDDEEEGAVSDAIAVVVVVAVVRDCSCVIVSVSADLLGRDDDDAVLAIVVSKETLRCSVGVVVTSSIPAGATFFLFGVVDVTVRDDLMT